MMPAADGNANRRRLVEDAGRVEARLTLLPLVNFMEDSSITLELGDTKTTKILMLAKQRGRLSPHDIRMALDVCGVIGTIG
jgi:hypothetical protein